MRALDRQTSTELEKLSGIVKRVTFHSVETGYTVLKVNSFQRPHEELTVIVHQSKVFAGATMDFYGEWTTHPSYGLQFNAAKVVERKPATANALEKYLGSGLIKGVGPVTAKRIVRHFGDKTLDVFESSIGRLTEVEGIARLKLEMISKAWAEHQEIRNVMLFLQTHSISTLFAVKIYKTYGNEAIEVVSSNPYRLATDIYGIGFFSADKVALSLGLAQDSTQRLQAAIALAKSRQATLLIAKLDRLSRNAGFIFALRDSGVDFVCADMPEANTLTIGIFAVLAQHERELISSRTKAALQAKKEQGFRLGSPQNLDEGARQRGLEVRRQNALSNKANRQASRLVRIYREQGYTFQRIADELNGEGYLTRNGKPFLRGTVHYLYSKGPGRGSQKEGSPIL